MDNDEKNIKKNIIVFKRNESTQKKTAPLIVKQFLQLF